MADRMGSGSGASPPSEGSTAPPQSTRFFDTLGDAQGGMLGLSCGGRVGQRSIFDAKREAAVAEQRRLNVWVLHVVGKAYVRAANRKASRALQETVLGRSEQVESPASQSENHTKSSVATRVLGPTKRRPTTMTRIIGMFLLRWYTMLSISNE